MTARIHIGIDAYPAGNRLEKCVNDTHAMAEIFGGLRLLNKQANSAGIVDAIGAAVREPGKGEWWVVTYSGHGTFGADDDGDEPDGQDEFLVAADMSLLRDDLGRGAMKVRRKGNFGLAITDSCFSGTVHRGVLPKVRYLPMGEIKRARPNLRQRSSKQRALTGVVHIAACSDWEFAYEGEHNGVLTGALIDAFDRKLTIGKWFEKAKKIVLASGFPQTPQINGSAAMLRHKLSEIVG